LSDMSNCWTLLDAEVLSLSSLLQDTSIITANTAIYNMENNKDLFIIKPPGGVFEINNIQSLYNIINNNQLLGNIGPDNNLQYAGLKSKAL